MLFNSYEFVWLFLPITLLVYWLLLKAGRREAALLALLLASLVFYAIWSLAYLPLLVGSLAANYLFGLGLEATGGRTRWAVLCAGVSANIALLVYFKYAMFAVANANAIFGMAADIGNILLPIGISFYTFQQIAYLVDCYRGAPRVKSALRYSLFVSFFPHLIAGPITHHAEVMPQLGSAKADKLGSYLTIGISIFAIGLFKKVIIADTISANANAVFTLAAAGADLSMLDSWIGALSYTLQIYFDFSGYSDMAVGLAWMFGVVFPINFASPYKAASIIDFWQRWHITLSRFLRDYVYIPLGGNRLGRARRYLNVFVTMLVGGIWHGAGWTYLLWGGMHGFFIAANHLMRETTGFPPRAANRLLGHVATLLCVILAWVMFRAPTLRAAFQVYKGMFGLTHLAPFQHTLQIKQAFAYILVFGAVALLLPNTSEWMRRVSPVLPTKGYPATYVEKSDSAIVWSASAFWAVVVALALIASFVMMGNAREFIYFQF